MQEDYLRDLVNRYLQKKSTDEELEVFVQLMKQGRLDHLIQEAMDKDQEAMNQHTDTSLLAERVKATKRKGFDRFRWPIAAAIAMVMATAVHYLANDIASAEKIAQTNSIIINNKTLAIRKEVLPDGSTVWINPNTSLSYPAKFGKLREVSMKGEAYFEVTKDHAHPFVVTSGSVLTKVWGTSFRIRSIPGEKDTKVSVLTGKVSVSIPVKKGISGFLKQTSPNEVMLLPKQEATYQQADHQLLKTPISPVSDVYIWNKSALSFENTRLSEIVEKLNEHYHVKIQIEGAQLYQRKLTADFNGKNLADILELICKSLHTNYSKEAGKITLRTTTIQQPKSSTN